MSGTYSYHLIYFIVYFTFMVDIGPLYMWSSYFIFFMLVQHCCSIRIIVLNLFNHVLQNCCVHAVLVSLPLSFFFFFFVD